MKKGADTDRAGCIIAQTIRISQKCVDLEFKERAAAESFVDRMLTVSIPKSFPIAPIRGGFMVKFTTIEFLHMLPQLAKTVR